MPDNFNKLNILLEAHEKLNKGMASQEDLKEAIELIMSTLEKITKQFNSLVMDSSSNSRTSIKEIKNYLTNLETKVKDLVGRVESTSLTKIKELSQRITNEISRIESNIPSLPDLTVIENKIKKIESSIPEIKEITREEIRNKLDSFEIEGDKLPIEAIAFLRDELDELKKKVISFKGGGVVGGGASSGGKIVNVYDLSSSLNGVLKTFSLPSFWRVIEVSSSSFPYTFRPTIDYTVDASAMTITFTSEISASTTLATGQTLLVIYAE